MSGLDDLKILHIKQSVSSAGTEVHLQSNYAVRRLYGSSGYIGGYRRGGTQVIDVSVTAVNHQDYHGAL